MRRAPAAFANMLLAADLYREVGRPGVQAFGRSGVQAFETENVKEERVLRL